MPELFAEKTVRARKMHECRTCRRPAVQPGETYRRQTYKFDGKLYDWITCQPCRDASSYVFAWVSYTEDGIGADDYFEWARDTGWAASTEPDRQSEEEKAAVAYLVRSCDMIVDHPWLGIAGHPDDPECGHRADGTDGTYCGETEYQHLHSTR